MLVVTLITSLSSSKTSIYDQLGKCLMRGEKEKKKTCVDASLRKSSCITSKIVPHKKKRKKRVV